MWISRESTCFSSEKERAFASYLKRSSEIMFGLTPMEVRELAYECATMFDISWNENKCAGPDWFSGFMKRNQKLPTRLPESCIQRRSARKRCLDRKYNTAGRGAKPCKWNLHFEESSSEEEEDTFCLVCCEKYTSNEWVQCTDCKMWAHCECAGRDPRYVCKNCETDISEEWE